MRQGWFLPCWLSTVQTLKVVRPVELEANFYGSFSLTAKEAKPWQTEADVKVDRFEEGGFVPLTLNLYVINLPPYFRIIKNSPFLTGEGANLGRGQTCVRLLDVQHVLQPQTLFDPPLTARPTKIFSPDLRDSDDLHQKSADALLNGCLTPRGVGRVCQTRSQGLSLYVYRQQKSTRFDGHRQNSWVWRLASHRWLPGHIRDSDWRSWTRTNDHWWCHQNVYRHCVS